MKIHCVMFEEQCGYDSRAELIGVFLDPVKAAELAAKKNTGDDWGQNHCWVEEMEEGVEKPEEPEIKFPDIPYQPQPKVKLMITGMTKEQAGNYMRGKRR